MDSSSTPSREWRQALAEKSENAASDKNLEGVASMVSVDKGMDDVMGALCKDDTLVVMAKSSSENEDKIYFYHHVTKFGGATRTRKTPYYVALHGHATSRACPVQIPVEKALETTELKAPSWVALSSIDEKEKATNTLALTNCTYFVRQMQVLPPFLTKALLQSKNHSPAALLVETVKAIEAHDTEHESDKDYDKAVVFCRGIVAYLWSAAQGMKSKIKEVPMMPFETPEVTEWSKKLHQQLIDESSASSKSKEPGKGSAGHNGSSSKSGKKVRTWDESFERLKAYKEEHGDCNVPRVFNEDRALGEWVKNQRSVYKTLSKERRAKLEEVNFVFFNTQIDRSNKTWEINFKKLQAYAEQHGDCKPPAKKDRGLHHWVTIQRQNYKRGHMPKERQERLEALGMVWKVKNDYKPRSKNDKLWRQGYDKLLEFYQKHGHANVPKRPAACRPLWEWVYSQRKAYSEKRLPEDRIKLMEEVGMVWDTDQGQVIRDKQWDVKYQEAKAFKDQHHHLEVPRSGKFGSTNLLKWLLRQREQFKNEKLCPSRKKLLDELGFEFEGHQEKREKRLEQLQWKERYEDLQEFKSTNGNVKVPEGTRLGKWVVKQQVAWQFRDLDASRKSRLEQLGVVFPEQMPLKETKNAFAPKAAHRLPAQGGSSDKDTQEKASGAPKKSADIKQTNASSTADKVELVPQARSGDQKKAPAGTSEKLAAATSAGQAETRKRQTAMLDSTDQGESKKRKVEPDVAEAPHRESDIDQKESDLEAKEASSVDAANQTTKATANDGATAADDLDKNKGSQGKDVETRNGTVEKSASNEGEIQKSTTATLDKTEKAAADDGRDRLKVANIKGDHQADGSETNKGAVEIGQKGEGLNEKRKAPTDPQKTK